MKNLPFLIIVVLLLACGGPEPRRPVEVKSGSFFTESVERSKKLLAQEEAQIQAIIKKDTANKYVGSSDGFWYYFETKNDTATYHPKTDDEVVINYNLMTMANDTIYTRQDIGTVRLLVDKEQLFPGLRNAIKVLKEGERATFLFPSSLAYGYHGDGDKITPATPIKSSVDLLQINRNSEIKNQN